MHMRPNIKAMPEDRIDPAKSARVRLRRCGSLALFLTIFPTVDLHVRDTASPIAARAQQSAIPVVGFLNGASADAYAPFVAAFRQGLSGAGYVPDQSVVIEFRWANHQFEQLPGLAADLVQRRVSVIVATGGASYAAKAATATIPIVLTTSNDPVKTGLVASLNRPGGNVTGVLSFDKVLVAKQLGLLHEMVPKAGAIGYLMNPTSRTANADTAHVQAAAAALGRKLRVVPASNEGDLESAFSATADKQAAALLIDANPFFLSARHRIVALAARHALPAIYPAREFAEAGGLMSYGASIPAGYHQAGIYAGKILQGDRPGDLPVMQPTRFELVINLRTARTLSLAIPRTLLAFADAGLE